MMRIEEADARCSVGTIVAITLEVWFIEDQEPVGGQLRRMKA